MNIVLLGIQGSGKGTLVADLQKHFDFTLISVGQLLRDEVASGSLLGEHIKNLIDAGNLVETNIVIDVLKHKLNSAKDIVIFDGFPRNVEQAEEIDKILNVDLVIYLNLSKEIALERIKNRLICAKCGHIVNQQMVSSRICPICDSELVKRTDDTVESVTRRFNIYETETFPLLERYKTRVAEIDANNTPDVVLEKALKVIKNEHNN